MAQADDNTSTASEEAEQSPTGRHEDRRNLAGEDGKRNTLEIMYDKVTIQHDKIDDFRAKLLGFLPVVTGIGLFALVKESQGDAGFFFSIGLFGAIASIGLFVHELRGITECYMLITVGAALEHDLKPETEPRGAFSSRYWWGFARSVSRETAALIVYPATIAAWVFVAGWPILRSWSLALSLLALVVAAWCGRETLKRDAEKVARYIPGLSLRTSEADRKGPEKGAVRPSPAISRE
jgi:hypothetical protein